MTDHHLDELASTYLDGVATPDEAARVESDPALLQRVEALGQVRVALRRPTPVDAAGREAALAAARAAFDDARAADAPAPLSSSPAARWRWSPRTVKLVGAAAAALLLAALVPVLTRVDDGDDDSEAARFEETGGALGDGESGDDRSAEAPTLDASPPTTTARSAYDGIGGDDAGSTYLGTFDSVEDLLAALAAPAEMSAPGSSQATPDSTSCAPDPTPGSSVAAAEVAGEAVVVVVAPDADGTRVATVYRSRDCLVLERAPLP